MKVFLKHSMDDLRRSFKKILLFEAIYMVVTSLLFVPALAFIFHRVLRAMGTNLLLNGDVYRMALSYQGLAGFASIAFVSGIILFLDFGTVLILVQKRLFGKDVLLSFSAICIIPGWYSWRSMVLRCSRRCICSFGGFLRFILSLLKDNTRQRRCAAAFN
jgi:glycerophosphoryl diester phosphodiesterase